MHGRIRSMSDPRREFVEDVQFDHASPQLKGFVNLQVDVLS